MKKTIKITFKNLERSSLAQQVVHERIHLLMEKFPELEQHAIHVTLSMDNSSTQPRPDEFGIKILIKGKKFDGLIVEKKSKTLYLAMADVFEVLLELLNRRTDKLRVRRRAQLREVKHSTAVSTKDESMSLPKTAGVA